MASEIKCEIVWHKISGYVDGVLDRALQQRMDHHFKKCKRCRAVLDGTSNIVKLASDEKAFERASPAGSIRNWTSTFKLQPPVDQPREFRSGLPTTGCNSAPT